MTVLAHVLHTLHPGTHNGEDGTVVARAVGFQAAQLLHFLQGNALRVLQGHVNGEGGDGGLAVAVVAHAAVHTAAEGGDILLPDIEARGQLMTAEVHQQVGAGLQGGKEVESAVAAAGAFAHAVLQVDHKAGAGIFFAEAGGHDAHNPLMPHVAGEDECIPLASGQRSNLLYGLGKDALFHSLPLPVEAAEEAGHTLGFGPVVRQQQVGGQLGLSHPSGGVDAGGQDEAGLGGGDLLFQQAGLLQKGL